MAWVGLPLLTFSWTIWYSYSNWKHYRPGSSSSSHLLNKNCTIYLEDFSYNFSFMSPDIYCISKRPAATNSEQTSADVLELDRFCADIVSPPWKSILIRSQFCIYIANCCSGRNSSFEIMKQHSLGLFSNLWNPRVVKWSKDYSFNSLFSSV